MAEDAKIQSKTFVSLVAYYGHKLFHHIELIIAV